MVALLSSKWVAPIPGREMVTGSIANIWRRRQAGILDRVPGEGIAVKGTEEGDNVDRRKWTVVIDSYSARRAVGIWGTHFVVDRKSTRLNSSHLVISYAVFCLQ